MMYTNKFRIYTDMGGDYCSFLVGKWYSVYPKDLYIYIKLAPKLAIGIFSKLFTIDEKDLFQSKMSFKESTKQDHYIQNSYF
jgi:hypothetical protein